MKLLFISSLILFSALSNSFGQSDTNTIDIKIRYNDVLSTPQYEVYMKSDVDQSPAILGSCQITVVFPSTSAFGIFSTLNLNPVFPYSWAINTTSEAPMANDTFDYYSVVTSGGFYTPGITAGEEVLLFTFTIDGDCLAGVRLFDRMRDPLPDDMDDGLDFENNIALQTAAGVVEAYDYLYGDLEPECTVSYNCGSPNIVFANEELPSGIYHAIQTITATNTILGNTTTVDFKAGHQIILDQGFEVQVGEVFTASIESCQ